MSVLVAGVILVGCTPGERAPAKSGNTSTETGPSNAPASAPTPEPSKTQVPAAPSQQGASETTVAAPWWTDHTAAPTPHDVALVRDFIRFSAKPTRRAFVRFGASVELGLGRELIAERSAQQLRSARGWMVQTEDKLFRGYVGPFSAVETVRGHLQAARAEGFRKSDAYTVTVGAHRHCASPPVPPPPKVRHLRRVAVLPSWETIEDVSCLRWFSVDLFVDDAGEVRAVTLDLWEP